MWAKSAAAVLLGLPLAVALVGLLALFGPGTLTHRTLPSLLLVFPVWVASCSLAFWFRRGLHAWLWMAGLTLAGFGLLQLGKALGWVVIAP